MTDTISLTGTIATPLKRVSTTSGISLVTFRLASSQRRYDRARGVWIDADTNWYSVSVYRQLADHADASLDKGDRVFVAGRLRIRTWQKDERSGTAVEIDAESLGPDLLFGTTTFTRAAGRGASAPDPIGEPGDHGGEQQTAGQDPVAPDDTHVATAPPGSPPASSPAEAPPMPGAPAPAAAGAGAVAMPSGPSMSPPVAFTAPGASAPPADRQPGWHVATDEAPF